MGAIVDQLLETVHPGANAEPKEAGEPPKVLPRFDKHFLRPTGKVVSGKRNSWRQYFRAGLRWLKVKATLAGVT